MQVLLFSTLFALAAAQCSFNNGQISASWQVVNGELAVSFVNKNLGNNQWTAIGFGEGMQNLEVVVFKIQNNKASAQTGFTNGYGPPTLDSSLYVALEQVQYNSNQLTSKFVRPLSAAGPRNVDLSQCMTWNFAGSGPIMQNGQMGKHNQTPQRMRVCPQQCQTQYNARDPYTDPIPQAAIYNNRQSSRFNGLYGNGRK